MKVLYITGANGFLGRKIVDYLNESNWFAKIFLIVRDKNNFFYENRIFRILTYNEFYSLDSSQDELLTDNNIEKILLHLAFPRSNDIEKLMTNTQLIENVTLACLNQRINKIINISSQSVYNSYRETSAKETDLPCPNDPYGVFKIYSESYLNMFSNIYPVQVIHLRLASLIGAGLDNRITTRLVKDAYIKQKIEISSSKEQFSYLEVEDAARMIAYIANNLELATHTIYNIGSFESYNLKTIVEMILDIFQNERLAKPIINIADSMGVQYNNSLNVDRMLYDFNLKAEITLKESLRTTLKNLIIMDNGDS